jgi:hypothetical protein
MCLASKLEWSRTVTAVARMLGFVYSLDRSAALEIFFMQLPRVFFPTGTLQYQQM